MRDLLPLPAATVPRLDDWLGVWSMDPVHANALLAAIRVINWPEHMARVESAWKRGEARAEGVSETVEIKGQKLAVISIAGTMMKSRSSMGGTSTIEARRKIREASADGNVAGILLRIDSPGGTVAGTAELANEVVAARRNKPVVAQIEDIGTSAAYWVASQASQVYASTGTALVGSIGTLLVVGKERSGGYAVFRSGPHKGPGMDGDLTEDQAAHLQSLVDGWQEQFNAAVSSGRRLDKARLAEVATGAAWLAGRAAELGLIDGIQPIERTLTNLAKAR